MHNGPRGGKVRRPMIDYISVPVRRRARMCLRNSTDDVRQVPPKGPRASGRDTTSSYRDKDAYGASNDGLDYGYDRDPRERDYQDSYVDAPRARPDRPSKRRK